MQCDAWCGLPRCDAVVWAGAVRCSVGWRGEMQCDAFRVFLQHNHTQTITMHCRRLTCFNHIGPTDTSLAERMVTEGLSNCELKLPPSSMKPHVHPMVHYPLAVDTFGPLPHLWILSDERRNKVVKGMSKHRGRCEASIARVYGEHVAGRAKIVCPKPVSLETTVTGKGKRYVFREATAVRELLRILGVDECPPLSEYKRATISGKGFTAGEPMTGARRVREKMFRCGSVCTMVRGGRSIYAWIKRFISNGIVHMAEVNWLPVPEYPLEMPVVVKLGFYNNRPVEPPFVLIEDIDPSPVSLLHDHDRNCLYVMRMTGIDTMPA